MILAASLALLAAGAPHGQASQAPPHTYWIQALPAGHEEAAIARALAEGLTEPADDLPWPIHRHGAACRAVPSRVRFGRRAHRERELEDLVEPAQPVQDRQRAVGKQALVEIS